MISGENFNFLGGIGVKVGRLMCRVPPRLLLARPQGYCQTPLPTFPNIGAEFVILPGMRKLYDVKIKTLPFDCL